MWKIRKSVTANGNRKWGKGKTIIMAKKGKMEERKMRNEYQTWRMWEKEKRNEYKN